MIQRMATSSETNHLLDDPVTTRDHALGPADAPITIIEYGDYECPFCLNAVPVIKQVRKELGDRVRFVFRHFPQSSIHPHASAAAEAAEAAADQGKFWEMHQALFDHQKELADIDLSDVTDAIQDVATFRAANGAEQSRLGFASEVLTVNKANLEAANSRIMDVDVAEESTQLARWNVLVQSGTAMLAQANQSSQVALRLIG